MEKKSSQNPRQLKSELYQKVGVIALEGGGVAIVDVDLYEFLSAFRWRKVKYHRCYYARIVDGQNPPFKATTMHRVVNKTPANKICHHRNRNTLDNRKVNLLDMIRKEHEHLHKNNSLLIKFSASADDENKPSLPRPDPRKKQTKTTKLLVPNQTKTITSLKPTTSNTTFPPAPGSNKTSQGPDPTKKKPEITTENIKKFPLSLQVMTQLLNGPDNDGLKKKPEITTGRSITLPIDSQVKSNLRERSKPPVMNLIRYSTTLISAKSRAVNDLFL